ncbi:hypothetical protein BGZ83_008441 [Gryganskiella cystojenkinii]|nr:hypothetical protein BGZ83_008441 [Gryganskiella cystojenkinii]
MYETDTGTSTTITFTSPSTEKDRRAWVTYLCNHSYLQGCLVLAYSLRKVKSAYKLIVMVPISPPMNPQDLTKLNRVSNIIVRPVDISLWQLKPTDEEVAAATMAAGKADSGEESCRTERYLWDHFAHTWAKLSAWGLTEYDRLVLMDCDMLVQINMDQLLNKGPSSSFADEQERERRLQLGKAGSDSYLDLPRGWVAAAHACSCNVMKNPAYPPSWTPTSCAYSQFQGNPCPPSHNAEKTNHKGTTSDTTAAAIDKSTPEAISALAASFGLYSKNRSYFNSGLVVLTPCFDDLERIQVAFQIAIRNPADYLFPDQDLLNKVFLGRWKSLGYGYNALKTLPWSHPAVWNSSNDKSQTEIEQELDQRIMSIRNIHYIMEKPWNVQPKTAEKESNQFLELYKWWWQASEELAQEEAKENNFSC